MGLSNEVRYNIGLEGCQKGEEGTRRQRLDDQFISVFVMPMIFNRRSFAASQRYGFHEGPWDCNLFGETPWSPEHDDQSFVTQADQRISAATGNQEQARLDRLRREPAHIRDLPGPLLFVFL
jgi:hypothetical protein